MSPKAPTASLTFSWWRRFQVKNACSQSWAANLKDAVAVHRSANASGSYETGRRVGRRRGHSNDCKGENRAVTPQPLHCSHPPQ